VVGRTKRLNGCNQQCTKDDTRSIFDENHEFRTLAIDRCELRMWYFKPPTVVHLNYKRLEGVGQKTLTESGTQHETESNSHPARVNRTPFAACPKTGYSPVKRSQNH